MKIFLHSLYTKLAAAFLALFLLLILGFVSLMLWSTNQYHLEVTQRLNSSLAMYVAGAKPLIKDGVVQTKVIKELAHMVMVVNPGVEVYLLNNDGEILANALPEGSVSNTKVDLIPVTEIIEGQSNFPSLGSDPRNPASRKIFSAFPVKDELTKQKVGYLYIVLAGEAYQNLAQTLASSHILKNSIAIILFASIFASVCAFVLFSTITKPLRSLTSKMLKFQQEELGTQDLPQHRAHATEDEIAQINRVFGAMSTLIHQQIEKLGEVDRVRRELISNVSHDLRTPLASMQGYLETLILKQDDLNSDQRDEYTAIAYKHGQHLTRLVGELFELTKLESGKIQANSEPFPLAELCQDVSQKFQLKLEQKNIQFTLNTEKNRAWVCADIALIERVLENLIENAIRYAPQSGKIELILEDSESSVSINVKDNGCGMAPEELTRIFDRYYQSGSQPKNMNVPEADELVNQTRDRQSSLKSGGLGLAIVKRILELHESDIKVYSKLNQGTQFTFPLPRINPA